MKKLHLSIVIFALPFLGMFIGFNLGVDRNPTGYYELHEVERQRDMWKDSAWRCLAVTEKLALSLQEWQATAEEATNLAETASKFSKQIAEEYQDYRQKHPPTPPTEEEMMGLCPSCPMWTMVPYYLSPDTSFSGPYEGYYNLPHYHNYFMNKPIILDYPLVPYAYPSYLPFGFGFLPTPTPTPTPEPTARPLLEIQTRI